MAINWRPSRCRPTPRRTGPLRLVAKYSPCFIVLLFLLYQLIQVYHSVDEDGADHANLTTHLSQPETEVIGDHLQSSQLINTVDVGSLKHGNYQKDAIVIAMVSCNQERTEQSFVTLKSAVLFTKKHIHFVIMADEINKKYLNEQILAEWPESILERISFEIHPVKFPGPEEDEMEWRKLFKPCASQRLFLPSLLKHIDSVLYVDNDVLFLTSPEEIWQFFDKMNSTQMAAAAPESEDYAVGWYNRFAKHPFVAPLGINSGVMLMNLTRLRDFRWETFLQPVLRKYKLDIVWGDQDIINIIFHFNTDKLFTFPCQWNYRPDHCIYSQVCKEITDTGVKILHGNRNAFTEEKLPFFRAIYLTIKAYNFRTDVLSNLLEPLTQRLYLTENTNCGKHQRLITKTLVANILNNTI